MALANLRPGGRLVINAIRKEDADKECSLELSYHEHLWLEREIKTVANITQSARIMQLWASQRALARKTTRGAISERIKIRKASGRRFRIHFVCIQPGSRAYGANLLPSW